MDRRRVRPLWIKDNSKCFKNFVVVVEAKMQHSFSRPVLTMMVAAEGNEIGFANLNILTTFNEIRCDSSMNQWNTIHCSMAQENFRAGESVKLAPPVHLHNYVAQVAAILQVYQQSEPQRVLLSLFTSVR